MHVTATIHAVTLLLNGIDHGIRVTNGRDQHLRRVRTLHAQGEREVDAEKTADEVRDVANVTANRGNDRIGWIGTAEGNRIGALSRDAMKIPLDGEIPVPNEAHDTEPPARKARLFARENRSDNEAYALAVSSKLVTTIEIICNYREEALYIR